METKLFKEVFPGISVNKALDELLDYVYVEKITMFKSEKKMVICILSDIIIEKKNIYKFP